MRRASMKTLSQIQQILRSNASELRKRYGMTNLAVFGSFVRGEAREDSDCDILADFLEPLGFFELCSAENHLCDLLGMEVDLVPRKSVRPELRERILGEGVKV
jgi:predicted nucleotidyltransferase